jgi:hypothetical protein
MRIETDGRLTSKTRIPKRDREKIEIWCKRTIEEKLIYELTVIFQDKYNMPRMALLRTLAAARAL